jgi:hypothetical protein
MQKYMSKCFIVCLISFLALAVASCGGQAPTPLPPTPETVIEYVEVTVVVPPTPLPPTQTPEPTPQNWDPASFIGPPPSCFSCKFPTDAEMRHAEGNPFIAEEDWVGIPCETCHQMENGVATEGIAWLNPVSMDYEDVNTPNELCEKCHVNTTGTGNPVGSAVSHQIVLGGPAHLNYAGFVEGEKPPTYCSDCHDPHTQQPKQCQDCHEIEAASHAMGKYLAMSNVVSCMACHDASGAEVGPNPDEASGGVWTTLLTTQGRTGPTTAAIVSHSIQYEVLCDRCHFDGNPWDLTVYTSTGEIPEPTPTATP